ncbi:MAG: enoyl-CoA hydratase/isomerase family protein [Candidatus Poseidoniaceae archaeon]
MAEDVLLIEHLPVAPDSDDEGVIALVTINRPDKLNALNQDVMSAIKAYAKEVETQGHVRCVIFTGAAPGPAPEGRRPKPNAFVAGADISEFAGKSSEEIYPIFADNGWEAIWGISKPTIAMIDGFALGGGCEVAVACDLRVASDRSSFGTPEINLGLMPGGGGTQRLARLVGLGRAMELVFTGEMIDATEAHRIGLVNHVVPAGELMERTLALARTIGSKSAATMKVAKATMRASMETSLSDGLIVELDAFSALFDSADTAIGVEAFLSRETPKWTHE